MFSLSIYSKIGRGRREMGQWLRAPAILPEDPSLVSSTHMVTHNDPTPSSDLHGHYTHMVLRYTCSYNTDTYKIKLHKYF